MDAIKSSSKLLSFALAGLLGLIGVGLVFSSGMAHRNHRHKHKNPYARWYKGHRSFPKKLSKWKLFVGEMSRLKPAPRWVPYDINVPLFSDYATKHRMIWMPPHRSARYDAKYAFRFPVGTIIAKTFAFPYKQGNKQHSGVIETRILVRTHFRGKKVRWWTLPYVWNQQRTEAYLKVAGGARIIPVHESPIKRQFTYVIPNANECVTCHHKNKKITPIGPKARNLNKTYNYGKITENQLTHWAKVGYLKGLPPLSKVPKTPSWDGYKPGSFRPKLARAYLDTNCAHCHQEGGFASSSALVLNYWNQDPNTLGICKEPVAAGKASGGHTYDIVPGHPEQSIMFFRMAATNAAIRMPELGRTVVDLQGLNLISNWIKGINRSGKPGPPKGCSTSAANAPTATTPPPASKPARKRRRRHSKKLMLRYMHQRKSHSVHRLLKRYLKKKRPGALNKK